MLKYHLGSIHKFEKEIGESKLLFKLKNKESVEDIKAMFVKFLKAIKVRNPNFPNQMDELMNDIIEVMSNKVIIIIIKVKFNILFSIWMIWWPKQE